jgi:hypothetical protein
MKRGTMNQWVLLFTSLTLAGTPALAKDNKNGQPAPKKMTEEEREWKNFKYYRARFDNDKKVIEEEKDSAETVRLVQNLPIAKDGLPVVAAGSTNTPVVVNPVETKGPENTAVDTPLSTEDIIAAEKKKQDEAIATETKRLSDEKRKAELEVAKAKLLGEKRDEKGQVIDDGDDPTAEKVEEKKGFFERRKERKKNKKAESEEENAPLD